MSRHATTRRARLLLHPKRAAILAAVHEAPGILMSHLRQRLHCSAGTLQHHVRLLERADFLRCQRARRRCRMFPAAVPVAEHDALLRSWPAAPDDPAGRAEGDAPNVVPLPPPVLHRFAEHLEETQPRR